MRTPFQWFAFVACLAGGQGFGAEPFLAHGRGQGEGKLTWKG